MGTTGVSVEAAPDAVMFRAQAGIPLGDQGLLARMVRLLLAQDTLRPRHVVAGPDAGGQRLVLGEATVDRVARAIADSGGGRLFGRERGEPFSFRVMLWRERLPWRCDEIEWQLPEAWFRGHAWRTQSGRVLEMAASLCAMIEPVRAYAHWAADHAALATALGCDPRPWPPLLGGYWLNVFGGPWLERIGRDRLRELPGVWHVAELRAGAWLVVLYANPLECATSTARHAARTAAAYLNTTDLRAEIEAADRQAWESWSQREPVPDEQPSLSALEHNAEACLKIYRSGLGPGAAVDAPTLAAIEQHLRDQAQTWRDDEATFVLLHGSLLGEVLVRSHGGRWLVGKAVERSVVVFPDAVVEPFRIARERWSTGGNLRLDAPVLDRSRARP